mmetsp:Transcript_63911/g.142779  ORF Transcript_63911/g.142779 Transcript_63911/m.142779 type:complete len:245 (+) Transcript_63911:312-1046(+)
MGGTRLAPDVADGPQGLGAAGGEEGGHDVTAVGGDDAVQGRDGAWHAGSRDEAKEANHGKAAVVDLSVQLLRLLLGGQVFGEAERVPQGEGRRVHVRRERGHVAGLSAAHVVRHAVSSEEILVLGDVLEDTDGADDLQLGEERDRIPHLRGGHRLGDERLRSRPRELDVRGVDDEANEASHCNAAMLDLGMAQPGNARLLTLAPEVQVREAHRIVKADHRVLLLRQGSQLSLAEAHRGGGSARL